MERIIFATNNTHKLEEVNEISKEFGITFELPPSDFNPEETGTTFAENSLIKASEASKLSGCYALADDSGLCVKSLGGLPGIHSARYAATIEARIEILLKELAPHEDKSAKFVCCMTLTSPTGEILQQITGECHGKITEHQTGSNGFGYDPIFIPEGYNSTMAELSEQEKNKISHRGKALREMLEFLAKTSL